MINGKIDILIVGSGMYVCGRGTNDIGTLLPALYQFQKEYNLINSISICTLHEESLPVLEKKKNEISSLIGSSININIFFDSNNLKSYEKALNYKNHDCAMIAIPDHLHYQVTKDLLNHNLHCLVVKPFVTKYKEGIDLIRLANSKKLYGFVEFHKRFDEANMKLKDIFQNKKLGEPLYCIVEYSQRKIIPEEIFRVWSEKSNIFQYLGVHYVDLVHFISNASPKRVMAVGQKKWLQSRNINTFDAVQALIEWELNGSSFISNINTNWIDSNKSSSMSDQKIKIIYTNGRSESEQKNRGFQIVSDLNGVEDINPYFCQLYKNYNSNNFDICGYGIKSVFTYLSDVFLLLNKTKDIDSVKDGKPTFETSLVSVAVTEAVNESLNNNGNWINISKGEDNE